MKSIRYKITQIDNVVVLHAIEGTHELELLLLEKYKSHRHASVTIPKLCMTFPLANEDKAEERINEIHAAIHKEFAGHDNPVRGDEVLVKQQNDSVWHKRIFFDFNSVNDTDREIWCFGSDGPGRAYLWDQMKGPEIPTGPCEVCYGIEGCDEGVQRDISEYARLKNTINSLNDLVGTWERAAKRCEKERDEARSEVEALARYDRLMDSIKEKSVIHVDCEGNKYKHGDIINNEYVVGAWFGHLITSVAQDKKENADVQHLRLVPVKKGKNGK